MIDLGPGIPVDVAAAIVAEIPPGYDVRYQPAKRGPGGQERWAITYERDGRVWSTRTSTLGGIVSAVRQHVADGQSTHLTPADARKERDRQIRASARSGASTQQIAAEHGILPLHVEQVLEAGILLERSGRRPVFHESLPEDERQRPIRTVRRIPARFVEVRFTSDDDVGGGA